MGDHGQLSEIYSIISKGLHIGRERLPDIKKIISLEMLLQYVQRPASEQSMMETGSNPWLSRLTIWTCLYDSSVRSDIYREVIEECWDKAYISILISCLSREDMYIRYMCRKLLCRFLNSPVFQNCQKSVIEDIIQSLLDSDAQQYTDYTDLLADLLCRHESSNVNEICTHVLQHHWLAILKFFYHVWNFGAKTTKKYGNQTTQEAGETAAENLYLEQKVGVNISKNVDKSCSQQHEENEKSSACKVASKTNENRIFSLLNVWVKLLRRNHDSEELATNVKTIYPSCILFTFTSMQSPIIFKRTLDLFHEAVGSYGKELAAGKTVDSCVLNLCNSFLKNTKCISSILPYRRTFVGFGGTDVAGSPGDYVQNYTGDKPMLRKYVLLVLKCCAVITKSDTEQHLNAELVEKNLLLLLEFIQDKMPNQNPEDEGGFQWLMGLFQDQDDTCVESLLTMLDVYLYLSQPTSTSTNSGMLTLIEPNRFFLQWLSALTYDHSIIVDLLASPETCTLLYIMRYLKYVIHKWSKFVESHDYINVTELTHHGSSSSMITGDDDNSCSGDESSLSIDENSESDDIRNSSGRSFSKHEECFDEQVAITSHEFHTVLSPKREIEHYGTQVTIGSSLSLLQEYNDSSDSESDLQGDSSTVLLNDHLHNKDLFDNCSRNTKSPCKMNPDKTESSPEDIHKSKNETEILSSCTQDNFLPSSQQTLHATGVGVEASCMFVDEEFNVAVPTHAQFALDNTMSVLIRTRMKIEKLFKSGIYAYNPDPLLGLIAKCEELYESQS